VSGLAKAVELLLAGRLDEARRACRKALQARADLVEAHVLLAEIYRRLGDGPRAREAIGRVARLRPEWGEARVHQAVGDLLMEGGRFGEAEESYQRALACDPALADARFNLAGALSALGRADESIAQLQALLERDPRVPDARERLVRLLQDEQRFDELEVACRAGMALHPEAFVYPSRLGTALWRRGREEEGLAAFRVAVERAGAPSGEAYEDARLQEATALLALGRYAEGWQAYRWRHTRTQARRRFPAVLEDPAEVARMATPQRIRVVTEQGLGDELFFLRFAPRLRERGHRLFLSCDAKLAPLLARRGDLFEAVNDETTTDFAICTGDLPVAGGQDFAPPHTLPVDAVIREAVQARLRRFGPPPYLGVTWRSGVLPEEAKPARGSYLMKQVPVRLLGEALRGVDARVVSLQRKTTPGDAAEFVGALGRPFLDLSAVNDSLPDALALLSLMHDYVGVSNTNTHLRAAVPGQPARVLVRTPPEWRWAGAAGASPWFPGFDVIRQSAGTDWPVVLHELGRKLASIYGAVQQR
jgi:Tfp pilus assembly protein PilF